MRHVSFMIGVAMLCGADDIPRWHAKVGDAFAEARRANKPIFAVLHCPH